MKILVTSDLHEQIEEFDDVIKGIENKYDKIILCGDFWDSFNHNASHSEKTARWVKEKLKNTKYVLIFGNHCLHYCFSKNTYIRGSGFSILKSQIINEILDFEDWSKFKFFYKTQGFLFSHAGINEYMLHPFWGFSKRYLEKICLNDWNNRLINGENSLIFGAGRSRGGIQKKGGITWQDWDKDFEPLQGVNQIVGHTPGTEIRRKDGTNSMNYCIDCFPFYVLAIENGKVIKIKL